MKDIKFTYVFTLADDLELPLVVTDTLEEMVGFTGFNFSCLFKACSRNSVIANRYRLRKVDIRDPEEKFNFEDYKSYCKSAGLNESSFNSLQRYRQYCFGC